MDCAIDECIQEDVLVSILTKHRTLAKNSILTEYDEKKRRQLDRLEGYEDGRMDGRSEGIEIGRSDCIQIFVIDHLEDGTPENRIIQKLVFRFQLDPEEAKEYVEKYK